MVSISFFINVLNKKKVNKKEELQYFSACRILKHEKKLNQIPQYYTAFKFISGCLFKKKIHVNYVQAAKNNIRN